MQTAQFSVDGTPVLIVPHSTAPRQIHIHVESGGIYIGATSAVTIANGYRLDINDKVVIEPHSGEVWAVIGTGISLIHVMVLER